MKTDELISMISDEGQRMDALQAAIGPERMHLPLSPGGYAIKDILAHISAYERGLVTWLREARAGRTFVDPLLDHPDLDYRNAQIFAANQDREAQEIIADFENTYSELLDCIGLLSDEELNDPALTAWFVAPRWGTPKPLWECIAADSYEHHHQHIPDLEAWLAAHNHR